MESANKCEFLSELGIIADAKQSVGIISIDQFDITIKYKDGTVERYSNNKMTKTQTNTVIGDLNGDNRVDSLDIVLIRREILSTYANNSVNKLADIDGDGEIKINDLVLITDFVLGKKANKA